MISKLPQVEYVEKVNDTLDAVTKFHEIRPDVVVMDVSMPTVTGIVLLEKIKRNYPASKILVFSDNPIPLYRKICMDAGADFFLDKSTEFNKLPELLK